MANAVAAGGTFSIEGREVYRLGFGAMRIVGPGVWGPPADHDSAISVLRRSVELGVNFIDTANSYGPHISEELIAEALAPYGDVLIATKAGLVRTGPDAWFPVGRPEYLRSECEMSLRRLGVETIDLFQLHRVDPQVPAEEQFGVLAELKAEGKVRSVGLSEVDVATIEQARGIVEIATVQNLYNLGHRDSEAVLEYCEANHIGFIPWFPIAGGELVKPGGALDTIANECDASLAQVALAWLLQRSPVMLPIPGTGSVAHLEENCAAASLHLSDDQMAALSGLAS